jgi:putative protein-disulfide isomerase
MKEEVKKNRQAEEAGEVKEGQIKIRFYTDPLCCWSWAFEPQWKKLLQAYSDRITHEYVLCGMIPDWNSYNDPVNSVTRPLQMGPVWMHASEITQVEMKHSIWHEDPPSSSYPACVAVKTAGLQSARAEERYLYNIRKALMEEGLNISKSDVLMSVAEQMRGDNEADFNYQQFLDDWEKGRGNAPFRSDLEKSRFHGIGRYPTLTFQNSSTGKGIVLIGYRPYEILEKALEHVQDH